MKYQYHQSTPYNKFNSTLYCTFSFLFKEKYYIRKVWRYQTDNQNL